MLSRAKTQAPLSLLRERVWLGNSWFLLNQLSCNLYRACVMRSIYAGSRERVQRLPMSAGLSHKQSNAAQCDWLS